MKEPATNYALGTVVILLGAYRGLTDHADFWQIAYSLMALTIGTVLIVTTFRAQWREKRPHS